MGLKFQSILLVLMLTGSFLLAQREPSSPDDGQKQEQPAPHQNAPVPSENRKDQPQTTQPSAEQPSTPEPRAQPSTETPAPQPESPKAQAEKAATRNPHKPATTKGSSTAAKQKSSVKKPSTTKTSKPKTGATAQQRPAPTDPSGKVVVRNGGVNDSAVQISPSMTKEQEAHDRENTAQLLATTDANLHTIAGHQLTPAEASMLDQIHTYLRQAKSASDSGDLVRAHTLAFKAHLLSDELVKK